MAPQKITEQQFRTRRRDRRMVWVDAVAAVVGLLLLVVSVGGVIVLEPEPEPIKWSVSWFDGKESQKFCAGCELGRVGGKHISIKPAPEGETLPVGFQPVTQANITKVVFLLDWIDDQPEDKDDQTRKYEYTNESRDELELEITTPWGETVVHRALNKVPQGPNDIPAGQIQVQWNFTTPPNVTKWSAFSMAEAQSQLMANYTIDDYSHLEMSPLGNWSAKVKVVDAGDQKGTVPADLCHSDELGTNVPTEVEDQLPSEPTNVRGHYDNACGTEDVQDSNEGSIPKDAEGQETYRSTYVDTKQEWVLQMNVWTFSSQVSL
ncbi:MAG: hypothetical protein KY455_01675 [Euryarchaeota archaeon]|nr:hypothetical protein [Euryarchaeota archaeon]